MAKVSITLSGSRFVVSSPFAYKDALGSVPTREWDPRKIVWRYAATPFVARDLIEKVRGIAVVLGDEVEVSPEVVEISLRAVPVEEASTATRSAQIVRAPGSKFDPWRHQFIGSALIRNLRSVYLAWEMGCGKTKGVIDAILDLAASNSGLRVLIVSPASVVSVWPGEFEKHVEDADLRFVVSASRNRSVKKRVADAERAIAVAAETNRVGVVVTNYESFTLDGSPFLRFASSVAWDLLVADEADRLSNPSSKTTRAFTNTLGPVARRRVCLSGTPMRNTPLDLYAQCKFLDAGIFGSNQRQFLERYAVLDFFGNVVGLRNEEELARRFGMIAYRIDKRSVLDLPPITVSTRRFDLSDEARKIYAEFEANLAVKVGTGEVKASNALVSLLRAQQMTSGYVPTLDEETGIEKVVEIDGGKYAELLEILSEIRPEEPVVVFCKFVRDLDAVKEAARETGRGHYELSGRTNERAAWQADRSGSILGVQIQAGGVGVDLTRSAYVVFYSVGFSLRDYEQAKARLDRPGQTRPVTAVNLVARGTVDEAVFGSIGSKGNVVEGVLDYLRGKR